MVADDLCPLDRESGPRPDSRRTTGDLGSAEIPCRHGLSEPLWCSLCTPPPGSMTWLKYLDQAPGRISDGDAEPGDED